MTDIKRERVQARLVRVVGLVRVLLFTASGLMLGRLLVLWWVG